MLERNPTLAGLSSSIANLKKRIESAKNENQILHRKIQDSFHEKGGTALSEVTQACTKAAIDAHKLQERLTAVEKKVAVKDDILLPIKSSKCFWANDKNCERKHLLSILQIGLNVLEVGPEEAKIEFVVNSRRIVTHYSCTEETFKCELHYCWVLIKIVLNHPCPPSSDHHRTSSE